MTGAIDLRNDSGLILSGPAKGHRRFSGDDPTTWHPDGQRKARQIARHKAAEERERRALELYVEGWLMLDIAKSIDRSNSQTYRIIERALIRRAEQEGPTVEQAKALYEDRLLTLLRAHLPMATGNYLAPGEDGEPGQQLLPDVRSAELALKIMDRLAAVQGRITTNVPTLEIHLHGSEADKARLTVLAQLQAVADQQRVVEGELIQADTTLAQLTGTEAAEDKPAPPTWETP